MIAILWRYTVRPEHRASFERSYGPDCDWARLFRRAEGYLGTELLARADGAYLTIDRWRSSADFEAFKAEHGAAYEQLDAETASWTKEEVHLGMWESEATRWS